MEHLTPDTAILSDESVLEQSIIDPNVFEILVSRYQEAFLRKLRAMRLSEESAEDIVQDAFVKIYLNAGKFKKVPGASFKSWAYKIVINTALTALGKEKREKLATADLDPEVVEQMGAPDSEFDKKFNADFFMSIVSKIPVTLGRTLTLAFHGKTADDIAALEKTTVEAVRTRLSRARVEFGKVRDSMTVV